MAILEQQSKFLEDKDYNALSELYKEVVLLGKTILSAEKYGNDIDDVYDIASDLCVRLLETGKPVILSAPSGYIKHSLFYRNKKLFHDSFEDHGELSVSDEEITKTVLEDCQGQKTCEQVVEDALKNCSAREDGEVRLLVEYTLTHKVPYRRVRKWLCTEEDRAEYTRIMKEIRTKMRGK